LATTIESFLQYDALVKPLPYYTHLSYPLPYFEWGQKLIM